MLDKTGKGWEFNFWTWDKTSIPLTVAWMESIGYKTREIKELPSFPKYEQILREKIEDGDSAGAAADIARVIIALDEGGLYLDLDFFIEDWSIELNHLFDFVGFGTHDFGLGHAVTNNMGFMAKPHHPVSYKYLQLIYDQIYHNDPANRTFNKFDCWNGIAGVTIYDTGPFTFAVGFYDVG